MAKLPLPEPKKTSGTWPVALVAMAAEGRDDDGEGMKSLLVGAGFGKKPAMSIIVKRPPRARSERSGITDPYVDDVLDALRALCA